MIARLELLIGLTLGGSLLAVTPAVDGSQASPTDVVAYASDLGARSLSEFAFWPDPASPGGKLVGTPNSGGDLDPPPEDDPHVTFSIKVQGGAAYRCWIHMKVGAPKGASRANVLWVQFSGAVDDQGQETLKPQTGSYLTAQGPTQPGWHWVSCDAAGAAAATRVRFQASGEATVRVQAGMEGVGFDQLVLSPTRFLSSAPTEAVVKKP